VVKVCHIARDIAATGGGEVVKQVAMKMAREGIHVVLITDTPSVELDGMVRVLRTPLGGKLLAWKPRSRMMWVLRHLFQILVFTAASSAIAIRLRLQGYLVFNHNCESLVGQVLVMHNVFSAEFAARRLTPLMRIMSLSNPVRCIRIGKELLLSRSFFGKILVSVSKGARHDVEVLAGDPKRVRVIENGVDVSRFGQSKRLQVPVFVDEWQQASQIVQTILFVGHQWKNKGLDELLVAMVELPESCGLIVVGGASQNRELYVAKVRDLGIERRVLFVGEWPDIRPFISAATIFCLPSHGETMPLVALEALAAGLPIVLTPECPASGLIVEGLNGAVTNGIPSDIAQGIKRSLGLGNDESQAVKIQSSVADYDWNKVAMGYVNLAEELERRSGTARKWAGGGQSEARNNW